MREGSVLLLRVRSWAAAVANVACRFTVANLPERSSTTANHAAWRCCKLRVRQHRQHPGMG